MTIERKSGSEEAMNEFEAMVGAPKIVKVWASGGCTGYCDYLMTDGSIKTFKVSEIRKDDCQSACSHPSVVKAEAKEASMERTRERLKDIPKGCSHGVEWRFGCAECNAEDETASPVPAPSQEDAKAIYVWFADNGNIRKWDRKPFTNGMRYVPTPPVAAVEEAEAVSQACNIIRNVYHFIPAGNRWREIAAGYLNKIDDAKGESEC